MNKSDDCYNAFQWRPPPLSYTLASQPRSQLICTENFVKFGHVVLRYVGGETDRHTDRSTSHPTEGEVINQSIRL